MVQLGFISLALFVTLPAQAARVKFTKTEAAGESKNHCASFRYTMQYADCSEFEDDDRLKQSVCHLPMSYEDIVPILKHDKCIKCHSRDLDRICAPLQGECTAEQIGDEEDAICQASVFKMNQKGEDFPMKSIAEFLAKHDIACSVAELTRHCEKHSWKTCELDGGAKEKVCEALSDSNSGDQAARLAGGMFGVLCSAGEVRAACGKDTCASLTEEEWHDVCQAKNNEGATAAETAEAAQEHEGMTCSEEEVKAKCPSPCNGLKSTEDSFCRVFKFGYTSSGESFTGDIARAMRKSKIECTEPQLRMVCKEREGELRSCDLKVEERAKVCGWLLEKGSVRKVTGLTGGVYGAQCSKSEIRTLCGSGSCTTFSDDDWESLCEDGADHGLGPAEFATELGEEEGITCTAEKVKEKCPNPCELGKVIKKEICQAIHFGYSNGGDKIDWTIDKMLRKSRTDCTVHHAVETCNEVEWLKCNLAENNAKDDVCKMFRSGDHSANEVSGWVGGAFGMLCNEDELGALCPGE